mmetsp:Transcript_9009/g.15356  ORF Transcript_9009/g.15356 Transcript_9009/m.15356 type:complete len:221 (+) Transcript_9009:315-977(+)
MLGRVYVLEQLLVDPNALLVVVLHQFVQQRLLHHRGGHSVGIETKLHAFRVIVSAVIREDRIANPCQMRRFAQIVSLAAAPNQNVVCQVFDGFVSSFHIASQSSSEGCNVLVVPSIAICNGCPVGNTGDLVTIVPPGHNPGILRCVLLKPFVAFVVVVHDVITTIPLSDRVHHRGAGHALTDGLAVSHIFGQFSAQLTEVQHVNHKGHREQGSQQDHRQP